MRSHFELLTCKFLWRFLFQVTNSKLKNKKFHRKLLTRSRKNKKFNFQLLTRSWIMLKYTSSYYPDSCWYWETPFYPCSLPFTGHQEKTNQWYISPTESNYRYILINYCSCPYFWIENASYYKTCGSKLDILFPFIENSGYQTKWWLF